MSENYRIYENVFLGKNVSIGYSVLIGVPARGKNEGELKTVIGDNSLIRSHTVIYAGNTIGKALETGHNVMLREENQIGNNVSIGTGSVIEHHVKIEDNVRMHSQVFVPEYTVLEEGCWLGPNVVATNVLHPLCPEAKKCIKGPTIKRGAKIGANVTILPDLTIGKNALVGAGAVVVNDVPEGKVVVGNPARVIMDVSELECPYGLIEKPYC